MKVAFRCDGDDRVGAGHVARSLQLAAAFRTAGHGVTLVGRYHGLAAELVSAAAVPTCAPAGKAGGLGPGHDAAVVDSYELESAELAALSRLLPTAGLWDFGPPPPLGALVHYHAGPRASDPDGVPVLAGTAYAPVAPRFVAARRARGLARALVAVGGSESAKALIAPAVAALESLGDLEVAVPGADGARIAGLMDHVERADVAVSAAGTTAYELACAGVPAVAVAIAENQRPVAAGLAGQGAVRGVDATADPDLLGGQVAALGDAGERDRLAARGPEVVDGGGAARIRDALVELFAGRAAPAPVTFRPVRSGDAEQLFAWRSEPEVRAASRSTAALDWDDHVAWLDRTLADGTRTLWLVSHDGSPAGSVRFDGDGERSEVSVALGGGHRGAGLGTRVIREATELYLAAHPDVAAVDAHVRSSNAASLAAFERAGYEAAGSDGQMTFLEARPDGPRSSPT